MKNCGMELYKTCREQAGLTQEAAAEGLNCSVRSLARYESGEQLVPDDVAYKMAVLYKSQYLAVQHLRLVSQVAGGLLPPVVERELDAASMRIFTRFRRFAEEHQYNLLEIAEDNVVSPEEEPLYDEIIQELLEIDQAILELRIVRRRAESAGKREDCSMAGTMKQSARGIELSSNDRNILPYFCSKHKPQFDRGEVISR